MGITSIHILISLNFQWIFDLFRDEKGEYDVIVATTTQSIKKFNFEKALDSALRFDIINLGVKSFDRNYNKNKRVDLKSLISKLKELGIGVYSSYIVGFPYQTRSQIWNEIKQLLDLNSSFYEIYEVHNPKIIPETPLWESKYTN